jgi:hypothetical protein
MDTTRLKNGQISTPKYYYEISTSMKEELRMLIKETSGLVY